QVTRSAGHGDYHPIVLAPASVQEAIDLMVLAFDLADQYRHLVFVVADGLIGQMMEPAELPEMQPIRTKRPTWALTGAKDRGPNVITSLELGAPALEALNDHLQAKIAKIRAIEQRSTELYTGDAELIVVGYGTAGRIAQTAVKQARDNGMKVGLFRPITLWPYPEQRLSELTDQVEAFLVVEMNAGQMIDDVRLASGGQVPVEFYGRTGGSVPLPEEIYHEIATLYKKLMKEAV
ncbi:MAG: 3-methyl-2-oxobutanoate dehydrogenase subunit beta, partial [Anaerolineae bacterium]|nr:3-methyl-2-oxobutanoate dehydrogenase subunit beta [Anaerolineae bacterium]